jgi:hypothetical protein
MKTIYGVAIITLVLLALGGSRALYSMFFNVILDAKDVQYLKVEELPGTRPIKLEISGHPFYSGMVVRSITTEKNGPMLIVSVHLATIGLVKSKTSGTFEYELTVPESVAEVRFGHSSTLIWKRGASSAYTPNQP